MTDVYDSEKLEFQKARIAELERELAALKAENQALVKPGSSRAISEDQSASESGSGSSRTEQLSPNHVERYSRQLLLSDGFGVEGQLKLLNSSLLVVGAGGIGSTVLLYLAASGVGHLSVVDFDVVEISNLHRQVIHRQESEGINKAFSAVSALQGLNPSIRYNAITEPLSDKNALKLVGAHDVVVDATDNPQTRYLINDACVIAGKPLVSASAIGTEGQLSVYNYMGSPCYRCLYPKPDRKEGCKSCSDNGVLGPVPGLMGILQAVEVLKIVTGIGETMHNRLLMYDSLSSSFLRIKKPPKVKTCPSCSEVAVIKSMRDSRLANDDARGPNTLSGTASSAADLVLPSDASITCIEYSGVRQRQVDHVLLDVRVGKQYDMCALDGALNIPLEEVRASLDLIERASEQSKPIYCICRRGIFSVEATKILLESKREGRVRLGDIFNVSGGLVSWQATVDNEFPKY